jgi:hypothetical protein
MANRVLLNALGLRVTKPGANVLTAGNADLLFSSDWSQVGHHLSGSKTISWTPVPGSPQQATWSDSVGFGKTFASVPLVVFTLDFGTTKRLAVGDTSGFTFSIQDSGFTRFVMIAAHVTTTGIDFWARYNKQTNDWTQPNGAVRYSIMSFNL